MFNLTPITMTAERLIELLQLEPLDGEGGYYRETYRSCLDVPARMLGKETTGVRSLSTAIYYFLTPETQSALHRLPGDEAYHFYLGDPVELLVLPDDPEGRAGMIVLGPDIENGMLVQTVVPGGSWQGSRLVPGGRFALMGTTMAPGFDFHDYQPGDRKTLTRQFPAHADTIAALTPSSGSS